MFHALGLSPYRTAASPKNGCKGTKKLGVKNKSPLFFCKKKNEKRKKRRKTSVRYKKVEKKKRLYTPIAQPPLHI
jgi:hypothetical protein